MIVNAKKLFDDTIVHIGTCSFNVRNNALKYVGVFLRNTIDARHGTDHLVRACR